MINQYRNYLFTFNGTGVSDSYVEQLRLKFRASSSTNSDSDSSYTAVNLYKESGVSGSAGYENSLDEDYFQLVGNWVDNEKFSGPTGVYQSTANPVVALILLDAPSLFL